MQGNFSHSLPVSCPFNLSGGLGDCGDAQHKKSQAFLPSPPVRAYGDHRTALRVYPKSKSKSTATTFARAV